MHGKIHQHQSHLRIHSWVRVCLPIAWRRVKSLPVLKGGCGSRRARRRWFCSRSERRLRQDEANEVFGSLVLLGAAGDAAMCVAGMQPVLGPDVQDRCGSTFCIAVASLLFLFTPPAYLGVLSILGQREQGAERRSGCCSAVSWLLWQLQESFIL